MPVPVSLIIAFYNKIDLLRLIFAALEMQTYRNFEIVIADDGSCPEVVTELDQLIDNSKFKVKHVWHEDKGWQKNIILNKAVVATEGEYLVFIDGDCIPHPRFIEEHLEYRTLSRVVCGRRVTLTERISKRLTIDQIKSRYLQRKMFFPLLLEMIFMGKKVHFKHLIRIRSKWLRTFLFKKKVKAFWGCNFSIWKSDLLKVNGFDERFVYAGLGEDTDLENRLRQIKVLTLFEKHLLTQYHVHHIHFDLKHKPNILLLEENIRNKVSYTPYGIIKNE